MRIIRNQDITQELAKSLKKWVLYVGEAYNLAGDTLTTIEPASAWDATEMVKCVNWDIPLGERYELLFMGGNVVCDSREECERLFEGVVGDDGPTELNPYDGPYKAFAVTYDPDGQGWNENA